MTNNFFRRNQKKFLALFGSLLMVVFILPNTCGQGGGDQREDPVVAYAGDDEIHASELGAARADWEILKRVPTQAPRVALQLGGDPRQPVPYPYQLGIVAMEIDQTPELFLLLSKEAQRNGVRVPPDRVDAALREMNVSPNLTAEESQRWRRAVERFLAVKSLYDRLASNVKISEPFVMRQFAATSQEPRLNLVEFRAEQFAAAATAPTTQELQAHFDKFANRPPGLPSTNPSTLSFGYQRPDRVKVQYLTVTEAQVREAVKKSKDQYEWEVAARRYYLQNQADFPVTQPATTQTTQPSTGPATGPATATAPATKPAARPTTRPFEEVREQVMERVMEPEVEKLTRQIGEAIAKRMAADYEAQAPKRTASTSPATTTATGPAAAQSQPATSPSSQPSGLASFSYLEQVAADIQKQFGVLPAAVSKSDQWLGSDELAKLPGIGTARLPRTGQTFANAVLQSAEAFMPVPEKADPASVLSLLEPSQPLEDFSGNVYVFRLTDAQRAHAPQNLAEVREQVETDVRSGRAYERALEEAKKFLEAAKKDRLPAAAAAAGKEVIPTGTIGRGMFGMGPTTIPNYPTTPGVRQEMIQQAMRLLTEASPDARHPVALIELPEEKKVLVAELGEVTSSLQPSQAYYVQLGQANTIVFQQTQNLAAEYFAAEAVKARLNYRSLDEEEKAKEKTASAS